jgi:hypothetical protein
MPGDISGMGAFEFPLFRQRFLIPLPKFIDAERSPLRGVVGVVGILSILPPSDSTESAEKRLDTRGRTPLFSFAVFTGTAGGLSGSVTPSGKTGFLPKGSGDIGNPGDTGVAKSIGDGANPPSSAVRLRLSSSCGNGGRGGESGVAANVRASSSAPGTALKEPTETCLLAFFVLGTGKELIKGDDIVDLNGRSVIYNHLSRPRAKPTRLFLEFPPCLSLL